MEVKTVVHEPAVNVLSVSSFCCFTGVALSCIQVQDPTHGASSLRICWQVLQNKHQYLLTEVLERLSVQVTPPPLKIGPTGKQNKQQQQQKQ